MMNEGAPSLRLLKGPDGADTRLQYDAAARAEPKSTRQPRSLKQQVPVAYAGPRETAGRDRDRAVPSS
jgi:hypothetical protein